MRNRSGETTRTAPTMTTSSSLFRSIGPTSPRLRQAGLVGFRQVAAQGAERLAIRSVLMSKRSISAWHMDRC